MFSKLPLYHCTNGIEKDIRSVRSIFGAIFIFPVLSIISHTSMFYSSNSIHSNGRKIIFTSSKVVIGLPPAMAYWENGNTLTDPKPFLFYLFIQFIWHPPHLEVTTPDSISACTKKDHPPCPHFVFTVLLSCWHFYSSHKISYFSNQVTSLRIDLSHPVGPGNPPKEHMIFIHSESNLIFWQPYE